MLSFLVNTSVALNLNFVIVLYFIIKKINHSANSVFPFKLSILNMKCFCSSGGLEAELQNTVED